MFIGANLISEKNLQGDFYRSCSNLNGSYVPCSYILFRTYVLFYEIFSTIELQGEPFRGRVGSGDCYEPRQKATSFDKKVRRSNNFRQLSTISESGGSMSTISERNRKFSIIPDNSRQ